MVKQIALESEYNQLLSSTDVVVVDFTATWCGPCQMVAPKFQGFSEQYTKATFIKVDVDEASDIAQKAGIRAMPTFQIFVKGEKVEEVVGASIAKLEEAIKKYAL